MSENFAATTFTDPSRIRNFCIIAHIDHGKSTLADRILQLSKVVAERDMRDQFLDNMDIERERGITIKAQNVRLPWVPQSGPDEGEQIVLQMIDTPGHVDFTVEVERSLRVLDGAVAVFDGKEGVEPQSEQVWRQASKYDVPRICFINKMDKMGADFYYSVKTIEDRLGAKPLVLQLPIGAEDSFDGVVDLLTMKALMWPGKVEPGKETIIEEIPADLAESAAE